MAIDRIYYCDNPTCADDKPGNSIEPSHARTGTPPPYLPVGVIEVREGGPTGPEAMHFCSWDCVMKYAARLPPPEFVPLDADHG